MPHLGVINVSKDILNNLQIQHNLMLKIIWLQYFHRKSYFSNISFMLREVFCLKSSKEE